jgi:hypothetical protein
VLEAFSRKSYTEGLRCGAIELAGQAEGFGGRELMGELDSRRGRSDGLAAYVARLTVPACIYKNRSLCATDGFRNLGQELLKPHDLYFR